MCLGSLPVLAGQDRPGYPASTVQQGTAQYPNQGGSAQVAPANMPVPTALTLPAGTLLTVRTTQWLSSDRNQVGDSFTTTLEQPLVSQGWVVSRRSQIVTGQVAVAQKAGKVQGVSQLAVELNELSLVDGQQVPIKTQLVQSSAGTSRGRDAAGIAATTGIGAAIGAAAGGGEGAAIGAAVGAAAGVAGVLSTRGQPTEIPPEAVMTFRLEQPLTIDTQQSPLAFQAVTAQDYANQGITRNPPRYPAVENYPRPQPYYYYPPYYSYGYYPPPYIGYGGFYGYGFGPRFYFRPRVIIGHGFGRRR